MEQRNLVDITDEPLDEEETTTHGSRQLGESRRCQVTALRPKLRSLA